MWNPQGTRGHSHMHGGKSAGHGCAGVRQGIGDMQLLCGFVGSDPKLQGQTQGWLCTAWTWEHWFQLGRVRCPFCGGKVRDATSVAAQWPVNPRDVRRGHRGTEGVWSLVAQSQEDRESPSLSLPTYLQEELCLPGELLPVLCCHQVAVPCHGPQSLHPVLQLGSHYPKKLCKSSPPGSTMGQAQTGWAVLPSAPHLGTLRIPGSQCFRLSPKWHVSAHQYPNHLPNLFSPCGPHASPPGWSLGSHCCGAGLAPCHSQACRDRTRDRGALLEARAGCWCSSHQNRED